MRIIDLTEMLPLPKGRPAMLPLERLTEITVHRTDGENSTPESTAVFHTKPVEKGGRGWSRIGYHFYVAKDGAVYQTLRPEWEGCHAPPNHHRLGVVFVGRCGFPLTEAQRAVLGPLLDELTARFRIERANVRGHLEAMPGHTDCPGDALLEALRAWRG